MNDNNIKTIVDLIHLVQVDDKIDLRPPKDLIQDSDYKIIQECYEIIYKYRNNNWLAEISESEIQADIIFLQSSIILLSERLSLISSYHDGSEDKLKVAQSKVRIALKQKKIDLEKEGIVKITVDDIKDASLALTESLSSNLENIKIGNNFIKYIFYSLKDFAQYLDKALTRIYKFHPEDEKRQEAGINAGRNKFSVSADRGD